MVRPALMKTAAASLAGQKLWTRVFLFLADSPFVLTLSSPALQIFLHLPACSLSSMSSPAHILIFHLPANQPLDHPHPPPAPPQGLLSALPAFTFPCVHSFQTSLCHHSSVPESVCCVQVHSLEVSNLHYDNLKVHYVGLGKKMQSEEKDHWLNKTNYLRFHTKILK